MKTVEQMERLAPAMTEWRRDFHRNPELAFHESRTAAIVADRLREFGLDPATGIGGTGVVAVIDSGKPGPAIALRATLLLVRAPIARLPNGRVGSTSSAWP